MVIFVSKREWYLDVFLLSLMIFSYMAFGANHEQNVIRGIIIASVFFVVSVKYFLRNGFTISSNIKKSLIIWIVYFFGIYFIYGNLYFANKSTFGGNDTTFVFFIFVIACVLLLSKFRSEELFRYMRYVYGITIVMYVSYLMYMFKDATLLDLVGVYRLGDGVEGELLINGNSNNIAIYMGVLSSIWFYDLLCEGKIKFLVPVLLCTVVIFLTGSKKGILMLFLYLLIFYCVGQRISMKKIMIFIALLLGFGYALQYNEMLNAMVGERFFNFLSIFLEGDKTINSGSTDLRMAMYEIGVNMWLESPFLGSGIGAFKEYSGLRLYSHNTYIELLTTFGMLGFILYYWYPVYLFTTSIINHKLIKNYVYIFGVLSVTFFIDTAAVRFHDYVSWLNIIFVSIYVNSMHFNMDVRYKQRGI